MAYMEVRYSLLYYLLLLVLRQTFQYRQSVFYVDCISIFPLIFCMSINGLILFNALFILDWLLLIKQYWKTEKFNIGTPLYDLALFIYSAQSVLSLEFWS